MDLHLTELLEPIYHEQTRRIIRTLKQFIDQKVDKVKLPKPDLSWYKNIDIYSVYADAISTHPKKNPLDNLYIHLEYIEKLGCNGLHILPFLDSPLKDAGFDVKNYYKIRPDLGTMKQLQTIVKRANELHIRVFMDLVFNHISSEHEWFRKAENGDQKYRDFFLYQKDKPKFIRRFEKNSAVWAEYMIDGEKKAVNIAFPEQKSEIPHFIQGKDGFWYYHTYYEQEIDLNWDNPDVFIEMAKILVYWTARGFNFRMDAIPFIGKGLYKNAAESNPNTHQILAALRCIAVDINPECVFLVESYEELPSIIRYFGSTNNIEANLSYNFFLTTATWVSFVLENEKYIWEKLDKIDETPKHASWLNFLRNHDELSLAYLPPKLIKPVQDALVKNGKYFRSKYGIAGRTYSLTGHNKQIFLMMYFLLMSLPGGVMIPYGDELGKKNEFSVNIHASRKHDTRNINRGVLSQKEILSPKGQKIFQTIANFFFKRQELRSYLNVWPERIKSDPAVLGLSYRLGTSELRIYINLSGKNKTIAFENKGYSKLVAINKAVHQKKLVVLGPYGGVWLQK
jgi:maltose alpha-D-glucosyltransferase/alpha-amylase